MVEDWGLFLNKAQQNIETANLLFEQGLFGLSAYHAQQAVELSVKAYAIKFEILSGQKITSMFKTHLPSKIILKKIYKNLIESFNKMNIRSMDYLIEQNIESSIQSLHKITKLMKLVDSDKEALDDLWKFSLGIPVEDSKVKDYVDYLEKERKAMIPFELAESTVKFVRSQFSELIQLLKKNRKAHLIPSIKSMLKEKAIKKKLPEDFFEFALSNMEGVELYNKIKSYSKLLEAVDWIDVVYGKDGFLFDFEELLSKFKGQLKQLDYKPMARLIYLTSLNSAVLLSYPHEEIGRYAKTLDGRSTEEWYKQQSSFLHDIIQRCNVVQKRVKNLLNDGIL